jgi:hypothetical protein
LILNASLLTTLQRCERRFSLESSYRVLRIRPRELFERLLRQAIFSISNAGDPKAAAENAVTLFMEYAASPGIETLSDPWTIAQDYCSMLRTVIEALSREVLLTLKPGGKISLGEHLWDVDVFRDDSGVLHDWIAVERWSNDEKYRVLHGWRVFGNCAATGQGMWLHVVDIGRQSRGHQVSPWCRIFKHPTFNVARFQQTDGSALEGAWKPAYFSDLSTTAKEWVSRMEQDNVKAHSHLQVNDPDPFHVKMFRCDLPKLAARIAAVPKEWEEITLERPACDIPPCPWQSVCYAPPGPVNIEGIGGFAVL